MLFEPSSLILDVAPRDFPPLNHVLGVAYLWGRQFPEVAVFSFFDELFRVKMGHRLTKRTFNARGVHHNQGVRMQCGLPTQFRLKSTDI